MKEKFAKLIDVKSIVTLTLTIAYITLSFLGDVPEEITEIYTMIMIFYFGTQSAKK